MFLIYYLRLLYHNFEILKEFYKNLFENDIVEFTYDKEKNKALNVTVIKKARYIQNSMK